eukprot:5005421-Alexandrium_andersonii.AAC.1
MFFHLRLRRRGRPRGARDRRKRAARATKAPGWQRAAPEASAGEPQPGIGARLFALGRAGVSNERSDVRAGGVVTNSEDARVGDARQSKCSSK